MKIMGESNISLPCLYHHLFTLGIKLEKQLHQKIDKNGSNRRRKITKMQQGRQDFAKNSIWSFSNNLLRICSKSIKKGKGFKKSLTNYLPH